MKPKRRRSTPARRQSAAAPSDWRAVEAATSWWADLRISEADLERVRAFLHTTRAPELHHQLVAFQAKLRERLRLFDWTEMDAATLFGVVALAVYLHETREHFPRGTADRPTERWLTILYRLILTAEDAGLTPLGLAQRAMMAVLGFHHGANDHGAGAEWDSRLRRHLGADAVGWLLHQTLTGDADDPLALSVLRRVRQAADKQLLGLREDLPPQERREALTGAIGLEIARRIEGRQRLEDLIDVMMEAIPPGPHETRWDYVARDAAARVRREHRDGAPQADPEPDRPGAPEERPDEVGPLRARIAKVRANPKLRAALEAETSRQPRATVARKIGKSTRMLQHYLNDLRREFGLPPR